MIYKDIDKSRKLVIYSILIKFAFVMVIAYYWFIIGADYVDMPFRIFGILDLVFGLLFLESLRFIRKS